MGALRHPPQPRFGRKEDRDLRRWRSAIYGDNFADAAGELYDLFSAKGCKIFGLTSQDGYDHVEPKAIRDGKFCGLMCDEDNQYDLSEDRAKAWVEQLKSEGFM